MPADLVISVSLQISGCSSVHDAPDSECAQFRQQCFHPAGFQTDILISHEIQSAEGASVIAESARTDFHINRINVLSVLPPDHPFQMVVQFMPVYFKFISHFMPSPDIGTILLWRLRWIPCPRQEPPSSNRYFSEEFQPPVPGSLPLSSPAFVLF